MIFDSPTRPRRRAARLFWPILIVAAIVLAVVVTAAGERTRTELEYLDEIRSQALDLSRSGASIRDVMSRVREIDREEFTTAFQAVGSSLEAASAFVADEPPTDSLTPVWVMYRQVLLTWESGVDGLSESILLAADEPNDNMAESLVADALGDLRAGDNLYRDFQAEFELAEVPDPVIPLVDVRLSPAEGGLASLSTTYVAAARSSTNELGLRPGLKVSQIVTDPEWQINVDGQPVVPATERVVFSAVITNSGNVASPPETVSLALITTEETIMMQQEVPALEPDRQTTVIFDAIDVDPDTLYEVRVSLDDLVFDSDPEDNSLAVQFIVNPA